MPEHAFMDEMEDGEALVQSQDSDGEANEAERFKERELQQRQLVGALRGPPI